VVQTFEKTLNSKHNKKSNKTWVQRQRAKKTNAKVTALRIEEKSMKPLECYIVSAFLPAFPSLLIFFPCDVTNVTSID
jgi:hypothetical protein